jgi:type I restriction enzyme R subunit
MLDTGFDCPEVVNLVMARFTRSAILYQQMRGRGTRKALHIKKSAFTLFDFVGVTDFHGDDPDVLEGDFGTPSVRKRGHEPRFVLTLDVHDMIDPKTRDWLTLDDQGSIVYSEAHEARANDLGLAFESWLAEQNFDADQLRWARMMESKIKADAEELTSFGDYFFDEPPFSLNGGYQRSVQLFGGEAGLASMLASFNASVFRTATETPPDAPQPAMH